MPVSGNSRGWLGYKRAWQREPSTKLMTMFAVLPMVTGSNVIFRETWPCSTQRAGLKHRRSDKTVVLCVFFIIVKVILWWESRPAGGFGAVRTVWGLSGQIRHTFMQAHTPPEEVPLFLQSFPAGMIHSKYTHSLSIDVNGRREELWN